MEQLLLCGKQDRAQEALPLLSTRPGRGGAWRAGRGLVGRGLAGRGAGPGGVGRGLEGRGLEARGGAAGATRPAPQTHVPQALPLGQAASLTRSFHGQRMTSGWGWAHSGATLNQ